MLKALPIRGEHSFEIQLISKNKYIYIYILGVGIDYFFLI